MESHKLAVKFFVADASALTSHEFVPVFHTWIQQHKVPDHLLIDVADYQHVWHGPGTLLISHEANFSMDHGNGELGLLYVRKQPIPDANTFAERLHAVVRIALEAVQRLEEDPKLAGRIKFRTDEWLFQINDRLLGPSNAQTFAAVKGDLASLVSELYGKPPVALEFTPSHERLFEVRIKAAGSPAVAALLQKLPAHAGSHRA